MARSKVRKRTSGVLSYVFVKRERETEAWSKRKTGRKENRLMKRQRKQVKIN